MYRSGNSFKYDLVHTHNGSHKFKLGGLEMKTKEMSNEITVHKNNLDSFKVQIQNMRREFDDEYKELKRDINEQKKKNLEINLDMDDLKNELLKSKNLLVELMQRTKTLQLRIDGGNE